MKIFVNPDLQSSNSSQSLLQAKKKPKIEIDKFSNASSNDDETVPDSVNIFQTEDDSNFENLFKMEHCAIRSEQQLSSDEVLDSQFNKSSEIDDEELMDEYVPMIQPIKTEHKRKRSKKDESDDMIRIELNVPRNSIQNLIEESVLQIVSDRISILEDTMKIEMAKLTSEIMKLRRESKGKLSIVNETCDMLLAPYSDEDEFLEFEKELQSKERFIQLVKRYAAYRLDNPKKFLRKNLQATMTDRLAEHFSWKGTATKKKAQDLKCILALKKAYGELYPDGSDETFNLTVKIFFQYAKERYTNRKTEQYNPL